MEAKTEGRYAIARSAEVDGIMFDEIHALRQDRIGRGVTFALAQQVHE